jgi:hypothetical protein
LKFSSLSLVCLGFTYLGSAQTSHNMASQSPAGMDSKWSRPNPVNVRLNEIPSEAYRHFNRQFSNANEASWSAINKGFQVNFQQDGTLSQAFYDRQGRFLHAIRFLTASQCDQDLVQRVQREFPGYQLDIISAVSNEFRTVYLITLKSSHAMKSVLYRDGSFSMIDDLDYAGR